ncbi:DUF1127 domain-containing protein [Defluviimonas sp. WL0002]|uniref:DUF1127 domain-containing protein n=1 Tax=Albidovulum marisflavi TaxID=2984159 RepID=A0ABT2ZFJ7_9RHOB|nr:DUF1127 domain-containing protein [Defluviimonas sp. WL0002]MCV2869894.1 DUF1127 domain-containing protein [Defluviimonas sp. WL0002]
MNTLILNPCCTAPRPRTLPLLGAILARIRQERRVARDTRRLAELSDDLLRDIGINRGDIPLAVRYGRDRDIEFARFR